MSNLVYYTRFCTKQLGIIVDSTSFNNIYEIIALNYLAQNAFTVPLQSYVERKRNTIIYNENLL